MKAGKITSALLIAFLSYSTSLLAQTGIFNKSSLDPYRAISVGGGTAHYVGDLTSFRYAYYVPYTNVRWNATASYTKYLNPNFGARLSFSWVRLYGDDFIYSQRNFDKLFNQYIRNLHFRNDLQEFALSGIINLKRQYDSRTTIRQAFMPYLTAGIGLVGHNPKAIQPSNGNVPYNDWLPLKQFNTSGQGLASTGIKPYSLIVPVVPLSVGFRMKVTQKIDINMEAGYRLTLSDYIDDVGVEAYPNLADLTNIYGIDSEIFSYRAGENNHAVTGESRIPLFLQVWSNDNRIVTSSTSPENNAKEIYDPLIAIRGGRRTSFYHKFDHYLVTQFKISYVLSGQVKCPPIR